MYIVVIGLGEVGRHLLSMLDQEGHDVVAVDGDPAAVAYAEEHYDVASIVGYGAAEDVLHRAGVARAVGRLIHAVPHSTSAAKTNAESNPCFTYAHKFKW